jgi:hypothetical protein
VVQWWTVELIVVEIVFVELLIIVAEIVFVELLIIVAVVVRLDNLPQDF